MDLAWEQEVNSEPVGGGGGQGTAGFNFSFRLYDTDECIFEA